MKSKKAIQLNLNDHIKWGATWYRVIGLSQDRRITSLVQVTLDNWNHLEPVVFPIHHELEVKDNGQESI
jgi:hypothetical protein